jgi:membrane associated rhomboid family serine protease
MSIADEIKNSFKTGNALTKLIYINLAVFLLIQILYVLYFLFNIQNTSLIINWLAVPADLSNLIFKPWTVITYMFLHKEFLHILFNILWLYWFGRIFLEFLDGKKLIGVYILGGISGAIFYILAFNIFPAFQPVLAMSSALGASASVLAVVIAISVYVPNYTINLMFIGPVKLKYIALVSIFLDIISIASSNSGGHIAHIGGAMFGYYFIKKYRQEKDITKGLNNFMDNLLLIFEPKKKMKVTHRRQRPMSDMEYNANKAKEQEEINRILDKIAKAGYDSLTKKEKELLFRMSDKN